MKVLLWTDDLGAQTTVAAMGAERLAGIVGAVNLPRDRPALEQHARGWDVPLLIQPFRKDIDATQKFVAALRALNADLYLVNSYSMILPADWLTLAPLGTINLHGALLPEYRGANALNWVLVNGESETGVTIHFMDAGIDTGDIILKERLAIASDDTAMTLRTKISHHWPPMLRQVLAWLDKGVCPRCPQDEKLARKWPRRGPEDGRIDWNWPAERIYNLIRALVKPWPGAFYETPTGVRVVIDSFLSLEQVRELQKEHRRYAMRVSA